MKSFFRCLRALLLGPCLLLPGLFSTPIKLAAQTGTATIRGTITDPQDAVVIEAEVVITNAETGYSFRTRSNRAGIFISPPLQPANYSIRFSKQGFSDTEISGITLNVADQKVLNLRLKVGSESQTVSVDGNSSTINTVDAAVGTVVDHKFVENMPLNGRSFQDLISMTPGVVTQSPQATGTIQSKGDFSVNGQRTESNSYTVDGVSANSGTGYPNGYGQVGTTGSLAATTALGTTQSLMSVDALQEFRVQSSTYSAEYGRTPGGQFIFQSRSGTNDVHGSLYDYLRNDIFDANDWFNNHTGTRKTALRQNDFGGTFGGPVWLPRLYNGTNKTFFFVSYEGLRLTQPTPATTLYVPSLAVRSAAPAALRPIFNAFPLPTSAEVNTSAGVLSGLAPFVRAYSLPNQINSLSVRGDHALSKSCSLFARIGYTPTTAHSRNLSNLITLEFNNQNYTGGLTCQLTHQLSNELRGGYSASQSSQNVALDDFGGAVPSDMGSAAGVPGAASARDFEPYLSVTSVGTAYLDQYTASNKNSSWNIVDTVSLSHGHHFIRAGVDVRRITSPLQPIATSVGTFFTARQQMVNNVPSYTSIQKHVGATPIFTEFSAFGQDEWHLTEAITLSAGIRWEVNPPPGEADGKTLYTVTGDVNNPATLSLAPKGTTIWQTSWYNFAPRLGAAWIAHANPGWETVVRAGGGAFFDTGNQVASNGYASSLGFFNSKIVYDALPLASSDFNFTTDPVALYTGTNIYAFPKHLQLPYSLQWSTAVEQKLGALQSVSISYVASSGRRLLQQQSRKVSSLNSTFGTITYFPNGSTSNYQALELKFQRSVSKGIQALASYTWSHSLDFGSTNIALPLTYGNSDFDVRHNLQAGLSMDIPMTSHQALMQDLFGGWGLDGRVNVRTAFPVSLTGALLTDGVGNSYYGNVNYDPTRPVYLYSRTYAGGRVINGGANNTATPAFTIPATGNAGNAPRNFVRGFGATQINLSARRSINIFEHVALQLRADAFNILNHPNFGYINPTLSNAQFGQATKMLNQSLVNTSSLYQQGGPRSMQFSIRLQF